jgi:hypothetical protein
MVKNTRNHHGINIPGCRKRMLDTLVPPALKRAPKEVKALDAVNAVIYHIVYS